MCIRDRPDDIVVIKATEVPDGFNAIGSCLKKEYTYRIYNSHISQFRYDVRSRWRGLYPAEYRLSPGSAC